MSADLTITEEGPDVVIRRRAGGYDELTYGACLFLGMLMVAMFVVYWPRPWWLIALFAPFVLLFLSLGSLGAVDIFRGGRSVRIDRDSWTLVSGLMTVELEARPRVAVERTFKSPNGWPRPAWRVVVVGAEGPFVVSDRIAKQSATKAADQLRRLLAAHP